MNDIMEHAIFRLKRGESLVKIAREEGVHYGALRRDIIRATRLSIVDVKRLAASQHRLDGFIIRAGSILG